MIVWLVIVAVIGLWVSYQYMSGATSATSPTIKTVPQNDGITNECTYLIQVKIDNMSPKVLFQRKRGEVVLLECLMEPTNRLILSIPNLIVPYTQHSQCLLLNTTLHSATSSDTCKQACNADSNCKSYSFNKRCWLSSQTPMMPKLCKPDPPFEDSISYEYQNNSDSFVSSPCSMTIPIQQWVSIAITIQDKIVSLYRNRKLITRCTLSQSMNTTPINDETFVIAPSPGFDGETKGFRYYPYVLSVSKMPK